MKRLRKMAKTLTKVIVLFMALVLLTLVVAIMVVQKQIPNDLMKVDTSRKIAINNVNIVNVRTGIIKSNQQVLLSDSKIESIRPSNSIIPSNYELVQAKGAYLMPGLIDMHVHAYDRKYLSLTLAHGVTTIRNMGGYPMHLRWKKELTEEQWLGSNLITSSPMINGTKNAHPLGHKIVEDADEARDLIRRYNQEGWDFIKIYTRLKSEVYAAIIEEATLLDIDVAGHVPYSIAQADYKLAESMQTLEHVEDIFMGPLMKDFNIDKAKQTIKMMKEMNVTITPTLYIFDHLTRLATEKESYVEQIELEHITPLMRWIDGKTKVAHWIGSSSKLQSIVEKRNVFFKLLTKMLYDQKVNMVLGSDSGVMYAVPGVATLDEIRLLKKTGIPLEYILQMATINAAKALGKEHLIGSIVEGKIADLLLLEDNPLINLEALSNPIAVIKNGQWIGKSDLSQLKELAKTPSNPILTLGRLIEFFVKK